MPNIAPENDQAPETMVIFGFYTCDDPTGAVGGLVYMEEDNATQHGYELQANHQRKRVQRFEPAPADGNRLVVQATNGDPAARVFEIRAYA